MPTAANPLRFPADFDHVRIGNVVSPGICKVGNAKRKHEWDKKRGKGSQGATITYQGIEPASFTIKFFLWRDPFVFGASSDPNDFDAWDAYLPLLRYDPTKKTIQAVDLYHPSLAQIGIKSVVIESIGNIIETSPTKWEVEIECLEYFPPPPTSAVATPAGSKSVASIGKTADSQPVAQLTAPQLLQQLQLQAASPDG